VKGSLEEQLKRLPSLPRKGLNKLWEELFGRPPGKTLRREYLIPIIVYRLQERAYGGLRISVAKQLRAWADGDLRGLKRLGVSSTRPKAGTRFIREWHGKLHEVTVLPNGYEYDGQLYRSLSEIARAITGTRWSGPAFFGLNIPRETQASR
jgi:hypothetical protein